MLIDSMLSFNPEFLEQKCIFSEKELVSIDHNANTLKIDRDEKSLFYKFYFEFIFASAKIEGNTLTQDQSASIILDGFIPSYTREFFEVRNYRFVILSLSF